MRCAGIDIGSRTIELVVIEADKITYSLMTDTGYDPVSQASSLLKGISYDRILATGMINRVSSEGEIVFTGGVAKNHCMRNLLAEKLGREILVPDDPQMVGAFGAALLAGE